MNCFASSIFAIVRGSSLHKRTTRLRELERPLLKIVPLRIAVSRIDAHALWIVDDLELVSDFDIRISNLLIHI